MKKIVTIVLLFLITFGILACKKKSEPEQNKVQKQALSENPPSNISQPKFDHNQMLKAIAKGEVRAPITELRINVTKFDENITQKDFENAFLFYKSSLQRCYLNALPENRKLAGNIDFSFEVDENGKTTLKDLNIPDELKTLHDCTKSTLETWHFNTSKKLNPTTVSASINYNATEPPPVDPTPIKDHNHEHDHNH